MKTAVVEVTNHPTGINYGKFLVGQFDWEWAYRSVIDDGVDLLSGRGWSRGHVLVLDLQTGEGAIFRLGGLASADLNKHQVWVCPMFEPFLAWLYRTWDPDRDVTQLPAVVELTEAEAPSAMYGHRRPGEGRGASEVAPEGPQAPS